MGAGTARAIVFDLDGTLVDSKPDLVVSVEWMLERLRLPRRTHDEIGAFVGRGAPHLVAGSLPPEMASDEEAMAAALELFKSHYRRHMADRTGPYPGIDRLLTALSEGGTETAVVTNKPGEMARELIRALGLAAFSGGIVGAGDMPAHKPDPRGLLDVCRKMGADPRDVWYLGDMPIDIETARAAGCPAAAVTWGYCSEDELRSAMPDRLLRSPEEVLDL